MKDCKKQDLISVIVPVYNVEEYLEECLDSIIGQTYKELEIILVDDGSTDRSGKICLEYKKKDSRVKIINKENGGLSSARNAGIDVARGKYLLFVDSDDFLSLDCVEVLYKDILSTGSDIAISNRFAYYPPDEYVTYYTGTKSTTEKMDIVTALRELCSFNKFDMSAASKLFKKVLFRDIRFPEGKLCEDYYVMYKLFDQAKYISFNPANLYNYRQRKGSITKKGTVNFDYMYAAHDQMVFIQEKYPELDDYSVTAYILARLYIYNQYIKNHANVPSDFMKETRKIIEANYSRVSKNKFIRRSRKLQVCLFLRFRIIYNFLYKMYSA